MTPTEQTELAGGARISVRSATRLAWSVWTACVVLVGLAFLLDFVTPESFPFRPGEFRQMASYLAVERVARFGRRGRR